jgi:hypothetical protein
VNAVEHRHLEIHQDGVGLELEREAHGLLAVPGRAGDLDALVEVEGQAEGLGEQLVVVGRSRREAAACGSSCCGHP